MRAWFTVVFALAAVAVAQPARTSTGGVRTIGTRGAVVEISADGNRVAVRAQIQGDTVTCEYASVWTPATNGVVRLNDREKKACSDEHRDRYANLTLAGSTAAWTYFDYGNHSYCESLEVATLAHPKSMSTGFCDGTTEDEELDLRGDGAELVFSDYNVCEANCVGDNGELLPDGDYNVQVLRIAGQRVVGVLKPVDLRRLLDARDHKILVVEPKGVLTVYSLQGKALWSAAGHADVGAAYLDGSRVVFQKGRVLELLSTSGQPAVQRTLPAGARLYDVDHAYAVYVLRGAIHTFRLSDGRDHVVASRVRGLVDVDLEPGGLFYAFNVPGGGSKPGRVTFIPRGPRLE